MLILIACTSPTTVPVSPSPAITKTLAAPCPVNTPTPRFLLVQPVPVQTRNSEYTLDIRLAATANGSQNTTVIASSDNLGVNGVLRIETSTGVFNTNKITLAANLTQRITVTIEFEDITLAAFPDASGNCVNVSYERTLQTRSDINGRPLIITYLSNTPTPLPDLATTTPTAEDAAPDGTAIPLITVTPSAATIIPQATLSITGTRVICTPSAVLIRSINASPNIVPARNPFTQVWRVRNNGNCSWGTGYLLMPVGGNAFGLTQPAVVPNIPPGATADLALAMQAPASAGTHTGLWRLRNPSNQFFGPTLRASITVSQSATIPDPTALPQPTLAPPTLTPIPKICDGVPLLGIFEAQRISPRSNRFTLRWGKVTNADVVELDNRFGRVQTPGQATVSITRDTTYRLMARCGSNVIFREVTLTLVP